jgi:hypothetical protein
LGAIQAAEVIQTLSPELKAIQDIEPIRTLFSELKTIQVSELMVWAGDSLTSPRPSSWLQSWMMRKKDAAICLCMIFLDPVNELPLLAHGLEFDPACFGKGVNGR